MNHDPLSYPYSSRRMLTFGQKGMVATSQHLAAQAGLKILRNGGNAVDAAVATAACLTVVEPTSNGIGSDAFALIWYGGSLYGINGSGPAPKAISLAALQDLGYKEMPRYGWIPVTVPGAPALWAEVVRRFGRLSLKEVLKPAIEYAESGYPVSPVLSQAWAFAHEIYKKNLQGEEFQYWFSTFAPSGSPPKAGDVWASPDHARTLRLLAESEGNAFYKGEIAEIIDGFSRKYSGFLRGEDLAGYSPEWVDPVGVEYRGYDVWEIPPNGQGLVALMALNILKGFSFLEKEGVETYHRQIEAIKLAFADGKEYITEKGEMPVSIEELLATEYAQKRRGLIGPKALEPQPGQPQTGGTVYLATADHDGNMVSFIQSNYMGFGSGLVVPGTGIALQNRGHNFSLDPNHANRLESGKRTYHTIIPGFLTKGNDAVGPFGVMGGFMQPQGHVQVLMNMLDFNLNPQAALDAPRWCWQEGKLIQVEHEFPPHIARALQQRGHQIQISLRSGLFGRGQIIQRCPRSNVLCGGTEPRADSAVVAW